MKDRSLQTHSFLWDASLCNKTGLLPYFSIDNARALSIQKRSKFVKNEHARYTLGMKKGKNLERLITATSQARF